MQLKKNKVNVLDYGMGNIQSVTNMVRKVGAIANVVSNPFDLNDKSRIIIPGVGSFDAGLKNLKVFVPHLQKLVLEKRVLILGICLGMQLLSNRSEEGKMKGLGLIDAEFKRFSFEGNSPLRVPHVGWNHLNVVKKNILIPNNGSEQRFYFTHSYHAVCANEEDVLATTEHGDTFTSAYCRDNIFGVQFHPEKSHRFGMALIKRFVEL